MCLKIHILYKGDMMRYYMYLDKPFLRTLFAVLGESSFNIDVVEYAVRKSYTDNNNMAVEPCMENGNAFECFKDCEDENEKTKNNKFNNDKIRIGYDKGSSYNIQTEKKYINITDITDMKNIEFYHKLIKNVEEINTDRKDNRIYQEEGYIATYDSENSRKEIKDIGQNDGFFRVNNICVWYDKTKLQGDIHLLSNMSCKIKVVGYLINCLENDQKILKALAIYIE